MGMFCYQCEQTAGGHGCTNFGVCGKEPGVAALQDLLLEAVKGIAVYAHHARELGQSSREIDHFVVDALFTTVTNVNFDPQRMSTLLHKAGAIIESAKALYLGACGLQGCAPKALPAAADWSPAPDLDALIRQGEQASVEHRLAALGSDRNGLQELITYGLKGMAAYAKHAAILDAEDESFYAFTHRALTALAEESCGIEELLQLALECGRVNLTVLQLLDRAHTSHFGHPVPTSVSISPKKGKAILVSGHDLRDLELLLQQTAGLGINIYTHGEMLPAHGYPALKKYPHLAGNYGGAWQDQRTEFERFPGAILMTTNCIQMPKESYRARIFTSGLVAWPGVQHVDNTDFTPVIEAARNTDGFLTDAPEQTILTGFGHQSVLAHAATVVDAVKSGKIRRFFLIGGCDGAKPGRNYFTEFAQAVPPDCLMLTLACGKYRFNKLEFGEISGLPRLLDCGQCNDAYSAIQIAAALAEAFHCGLNDLPLSLILSWYEQKAVCILLSLLALGVKNIRLGPTLPAFLTPNVLQVLVEKFAIKPTTTVERDLEAALAGS